jgi:hypothetical protein
MLWLDIEGPGYWTGDQGANQNFFNGLVSQARAHGLVRARVCVCVRACVCVCLCVCVCVIATLNLSHSLSLHLFLLGSYAVVCISPSSR